MKHYTQSSQNLFFNKIQSMTTSHKGKYFFMKTLNSNFIHICTEHHIKVMALAPSYYNPSCPASRLWRPCVCKAGMLSLSQTQIALFTSGLTHFSLSNFYPNSHVWNMWQCNLNMLSAGNKQGRRQTLSKVLSERKHLQQPLPTNSKLFCT